MEKSPKLKELATYVNRSYEQTEFLYGLVGENYVKMCSLEMKMKIEHIYNVPETPDEAEAILEISWKEKEFSSWENKVMDDITHIFNNHATVEDLAFLARELNKRWENE